MTTEAPQKRTRGAEDSGPTMAVSVGREAVRGIESPKTANVSFRPNLSESPPNARRPSMLANERPMTYDAVKAP